jgi:DNA invertase Pin-like site-specific DNA recombinase
MSRKINVTLTIAATPKQIAKKYGVSLSQVLRKLNKGIKTEMEHTKNRQVAMKIAIDHLLEDFDYYSKVFL